nr:glycoside hydrolase N-terminal domain-containing protein [Nakamurella aerolata]
MKRPPVSFALTLGLVLAMLGAVPAAAEPSGTGSATASAAPAASAADSLRMWYTKPVANWENDALVQGNGSTGLMAYGAPSRERLHVNEKTLWRGGPAAGRDYIGGNRSSAVTPEQLENYRKALDDKSRYVFGLPATGPGGANEQLTSLMFGNTGGMGQYQDFGDVYLDLGATGVTDAGVKNYVRDLDLNTAISTVSYQADGVRYQREYLVSYPDQVAVVKLSASEPGKLSFTASTAAAAGLTTTATADAAAKRITLAGTVNDNQMRTELQLKLVNSGGSVSSTDGKTLSVAGADEVTLVYSTGTDYRNAYPAYRGENPHAAITQRVDAAAARSYSELRQRHLADYQNLFSRVRFDVGGQTPDIPTDQLMRNYRAGQYDLAVDELAYQFGRYLSIAGSRAGNLPTNLNGLWMVGDAGKYWGADYHFNVNVQMNYWPALTTNLAETQVPFNSYVQSLVVPGRLTADRSAAVATPDFAGTPIGSGNGFLINTQVNPFGHTAPIGSQEYGWNIGGSSWALQNVYDYYLFTGDKEFLRSTAYPMLKEMATFWNTYLWWSDYQQRLTVAPGVSAEQGPTAVGTTYDQSLVWELYRMAIDASKTLGMDADQRAVWESKQNQLKPIMIGVQG